MHESWAHPDPKFLLYNKEQSRSFKIADADKKRKNITTWFWLTFLTPPWVKLLLHHHSTTVCLNDHRFAAWRALRLTKQQTFSKVPSSFDSCQFATKRPNRSTDDEISSELWVSNVWRRGTSLSRCCSLILVNFQHNNLQQTDTSERIQFVRVGRSTSSVITSSTGTPQGCVPSPLLFTLLTHDYAAGSTSNCITKSDDGTMLVSLIWNDHDWTYEAEEEQRGD